MATGIATDIVCSRCNTHLSSKSGNVMEQCPTCGAYLVWENVSAVDDSMDLGLTLQIDSNFEPRTAQAIKQVIAECRHPERLIPAVSRFALQLIPLLQDPRVDLVELSNHIEKDQALVGNLFKVANSAYYQGRGAITRINEALVRLGIKQTQTVVLATISRQMHLIKNDAFGVLGDKLWYHAVATSFACREMAQMTGSIDPDEAYAAGLLHDIGRVVVLRAVNELSIRNKIDFGPQGPSLAVAVMDFLHVRMGSRLLDMWGLPESLALPAAWHHTNDLPPRQPDMVRLVKAMDQLAIMAGFGASDSATTNETEDSLAQRYNFQASDLNEVRELLQ